MSLVSQLVWWRWWRRWLLVVVVVRGAVAEAVVLVVVVVVLVITIFIMLCARFYKTFLSEITLLNKFNYYCFSYYHFSQP
jgi:hypothetical protein